MGALARIFLRLGATAFGGPAAHVALFREEFVVRRGWLTSQAFLDLLSAANLLPGPSSTEVAIGIGRERAGLRGMLVAGVAFITPAAFLVLLLAMLYQRLGTLAAMEWALGGIQAVVVVVVIRAAIALAPVALPAPLEWCIAIGGCVLGLLAVHLLEGIPGAVAATIAIFVPAFVFVGLAHPWLARMRASATLGAAMDGINAASIGLLIAVAVDLGRGALLGASGILIALAAVILVWRYHVGTVWLLVGGAVCGVVAGATGGS